jgi:hypothetical protein
MRLFALTAFALFLLPVIAFANSDSDSRVFPPDNCNTTERRVLSWQDGTEATYCLTGQDILKLAVPNCAANQHVVYDGTNFICKTVEIETKVVTCALQYTGPADNSWGCTATCPDDYTVTGGGFDAPAAYTTGGHYSRPSGNGWISDIGAVDHCTTGTPPCQSSAGYAICAKVK